MAKKVVQSVDRALGILEILVEVNQPITLSEISEISDLNISTVHRLLNTLISRGFADQDKDSGKYKLGIRIFEIVTTLGNSISLKSTVRPYLEEVVKKCNETANLVVLDQGQVLYIDQVESTNMVRMFANIGSKGPAHALGAGKVLLSFLKEEEVNQILKDIELTRFTRATITDIELLKKDLKEIRKRGYAIDFEEMEEGVKCVAAPIFNSGGDVIAAISVSGPDTRITDAYLYNSLVPLVTAKAKEISKEFVAVRS